MGRPRKPKELKKAQGTYRKDRDPGPEAVEAPPGEPSCPKTLSADARAVWKEVVPQLIEIGTLAKTDGGVVEAYCRTLAQVRKLDEESNGQPVVDTPWGPKVHPAIPLMAKLLPPLEKLAFSLGLHFIARSRGKLPPKPKEADPVEEELFGQLKVVNGGRAAPAPAPGPEKAPE